MVATYRHVGESVIDEDQLRLLPVDAEADHLLDVVLCGDKKKV